MKYNVIISDYAVETFDSIKEQINIRWGDKPALEFEQRVLNVLELISGSPFVFRSLSSDGNIRKGFIHRNCSMFYEIKEHTIIILFFWDNRQAPIFT
jgi:plasmid stabilization system protein ParE